MRELSVFLACLALACGNNPDDRATLVPTSVEIGDIYTCVIETAADGADAGTDDAGMIDAGGVDAGLDDAGLDAGVDDAGMPDVGALDAGDPDAGAFDAGVDGGGVDDGELEPVIRPHCWELGELPQRLNLGQPLRGRIFLGDPLCNLADGRVQCLGPNDYGQVGDGTETATTTPTRVVTPRPATGMAVNRYGTEGFACAVLENGGVSCWGFGEAGQLGNGLSDNRNVPTTVPGVRGAYLITAGGAHVCVAFVDVDEEMGIETPGISCWGLGERGQLGDGTSSDNASPVSVSTTAPEGEPFLERPIALGAGFEHTCALDMDGEVWCWGAGELGQLGNGASVDQSRPVRVSLTRLVEEGMPEPTVVGLAVGGNHTCALTSDGVVACWGSNENLQTGVGGGATVLTPSAVLSDASLVVAGRSHTCAIVGTDVKCWGQAAYLGTGVTEGDTATPRTVRY